MAETRKARREAGIEQRELESTLPTYDQLMSLMQDTQHTDPQLFQAAYGAIERGDYQKMGAGEALGLGAGQGFTLGFGEEMAAGIRAAADRAMANFFGIEERTPDYMETYQKRLGEKREQLERARRERPGEMFAGEMLGGAATGGTGLARSVAGRTILPALGRAITTSTGLGAGTGYGMSEGDPIAAAVAGEEVRPELMEAGADALMGAGIGFGLGPLGPLTGWGGKAIGRKIAGMTQRGQQAKIDEAARMAVEQRMMQADIAPYEMQQMLDINPAMTVGDVDEGMRDLVQSVAQTPTPGARSMREKLKARNKGAYQRINPALAKAFDKTTTNTAEAIDTFKAEAKAAAKANYKKAYEKPANMSREMLRILETTQEGQFALDQARRARQSRGLDPEHILKPNSPQSMQDMDTILRSLKNQERKAWQDVETQTFADVIGKNADAFEAELYAQNPAFEIARTTHGTKQSNIDAFEYGRNIFSEDPNRVQLDIKDLSDTDTDLMRLGILDALTQKVKQKQYAADPTKAVINSRRDEEIFELVVGGPDQLRQFEDLIKTEQMMFDAMKKGTTGSPTAKLQQAQKANAAKAMEYSLYALGQQNPASAAQGVMQMGQAAVQAMRDPKIADEAAERFYNTQANLLMGRDLQAIQTPGRIAGLLSPEVPTLPARAMGGLLATGGPQPSVEYGLPE